jgi:predicted DNA-binding protein (UPF0251 family)
MSQLEHVHLKEDEFEALRLVDLLGMQQQEAAVAMGVSRQTLANVLKAARFKVVDCLTQGKALIMHSERKELHKMITAIPVNDDRVANHFTKASHLVLVDERGVELSRTENPAGRRLFR